jgi:conjugal transfer pilus assembly protein TraK
MAILELSAGASLAPRLWWAERALGVALMGVGLANAAPAYADQTLLVADNGTVHCEASAKDLTRISLKDDQFASVSKVQAANPADDFQVVNEPLRGDIYLSVANGFSKPTISFFGTTRKGFVYKFICAVGGSTPGRCSSPMPMSSIRAPWASMACWPLGQDASARLIAAMYAQKPVEGFDITWRALVPVNIETLVVQMVGQYVGRPTPASCSRSPIAAPSPHSDRGQGCACRRHRGEHHQPASGPGEATTAFIVQRSADAGGQP